MLTILCREVAGRYRAGLLLSHDLLTVMKIRMIAISAGIFYRLKDALMPVVKLDY